MKWILLFLKRQPQLEHSLHVISATSRYRYGLNIHLLRRHAPISYQEPPCNQAFDAPRNCLYLIVGGFLVKRAERRSARAGSADIRLLQNIPLQIRYLHTASFLLFAKRDTELGKLCLLDLGR